MIASLERGVLALRKVIDAPVASFFGSCVHCGLCAEACLFYTETGNPEYTPIRKVEPMRRLWSQEFTLAGRLAKWIGISKPVTDDELARWSELAYDTCTLCGRCSAVCPVGNDIAYLVRKFREGLAAAGHAPEGLVGATTRAVTLGSPMGIKWKAVEAQIKRVEKETGLTVPVDVAGAEYLCLMSSMEIINFPEYLAALTRIFRHSGVSWTLSTEAFEATNSGIQIGASDLAREIVSRIVVAAEKLGVRNVVSPECGHAFTALRWDGPNLVGKPYSFAVVHILELLESLYRAGRIRLNGKKSKTPLTYHDPCQIARRGGVIDQPRTLLAALATDFREMPDAGKMNWCCGGGGGVSANERAEPIRVKVFSKKKAQIEATGVSTVVTACANCRIVMEEGLEHYHMDVTLIGLTELLAEQLAEPLAKEGSAS